MKNDMCECKCGRENQIISELHIYIICMCACVCLCVCMDVCIVYTNFVNPSKLRERTIDQIEQLIQRQHDEVSSFVFCSLSLSK